MNTAITKVLVKNVLENPQRYLWEIQGLGMLRTYLDDNVRLHIWDKRLVIPGVTPIHNHAWNLKSTIVVGRMLNTKYFIVAPNGSLFYNRFTISTDDGKVLNQNRCGLMVMSEEIYAEGDSYSQWWHEIHSSTAENGTVTIIERTDQRDERTADVFGSGHREFVSAAPREATQDEAAVIIHSALLKWFYK